ncbi:hypothetical protein [Streptomyces sp. DSM 15324]|nr:hypothetical protein [Streptomyces sp. DSM 15324]
MITAAPGIADQARLTEAVHGLVARARAFGLTDQELLSLVHNCL